MPNIANIKSLQGMGVYADRGVRSPSLQFRRYNLIYGFNGSGKSTLSRIFASLQAGQPHPKLPDNGKFEVSLDDGSVFGCPSNPAGLERRIVVFNADYIEQNLQWAAGRANPVFYIGSDQAEAARELTKVEADISDVEHEMSLASVTELTASKAFVGFKRHQAKLIASLLHLGSRRYEALALIKDYKDWKDDDRLVLSDRELKAAEDTCRLDEPMPRLESISFDKTTIEAAYRFIVDVCGQSVATVALGEVQRHPEMLLWVKSGHEYHESRELSDCLLCGNAISDDRRVLLAAALDNRLNQFLARLRRTAERLDALIRTAAELVPQLPVLANLSSALRATFREAHSVVAAEADVLRAHLCTLQIALAAKLERPATPVDMTDCCTEADFLAVVDRIAAGVASVNQVILEHNRQVAGFAKHKAAAEESIRRHFVADCRDEYARMEGDLTYATARVREAAAKVAALRERARILRLQITSHGPAASIINKLIAAYLGHGELTINPVSEGYELQRHGTPIVGVPSEGEKTAIAISYFMSSIEADNRKLNDVIVVVDDPVSSLDTKALNFACSLVRKRLENAAQVFIFTHNLQCMNEFKKAWKGRARPTEGKETTAAFLFIDVTHPEGQSRRFSNIVQMSKLLREYDSEYHFLFDHVLRFVRQPDAHDDHGYMIPNVIRRVLDVFLAFKCPGGGGLPSQLDKLHSDYPVLDRERLAALERLAQVESHSDNIDDLLSFSTMTLEETRGAANALFDMIEVVDPKHLERLKVLCR